MTPFFITEKRVEELLERETRYITLPQGRARMTNFKAFWRAYDFLIFFGIITPEMLVQAAITTSKETGACLYRSLEAEVWTGNNTARRILGIDCFGVHTRPARGQ